MNLRTQALFHPSVVVWGDEILDQAKVVPKDHQCKDQEMDMNRKEWKALHKQSNIIQV